MKLLWLAPLLLCQDGFDDIEQALKDAHVPGLAIAVVKDDSVLLCKGYGVRRQGEPGAVDDETLFMIGSCTKAFTATAVGILVDEKKLDWDDPVVKYLPELKMYDPYVTRELTVRDLLCHRSGLPRGDLAWFVDERLTREQILQRVQYLKPAVSFRSKFGYQNFMFTAAGEVVRAASGMPWEEFVRERIFKPIGMSRSLPGCKGEAERTNVAWGHAEGEPSIAHHSVDPVGPAGSIHSCARDMAEWLKANLRVGSNEPLLRKKTAVEMQTAQMPVPNEPPWSGIAPGAKFVAYGLGWFLHDYRGKKVVEHGGATDGYSTMLVMVPEEKIGVVVMANMHGSGLPHALAYRVIDTLLGVPPKGKLRVGPPGKPGPPARVAGTTPSLKESETAGKYRHDFYGEISVTEQNGGLVLQWGTYVADLEHWHYDTYRAKWRRWFTGVGLVTFRRGTKGKVDELVVELLDPPETAAFRR
jgi:CubicO group peptidase (beta-lactamase class C family)